MTTASMPAAPVKTKDVLVGLLDDFIADKCLKPGDRLPSIRDLAAHFGVKSGIVRDALLDAQGKGVVKLLPRAGAFVQTVNNLPSDSSPPERMGSRLKDLLATQEQNLFHLMAVRETLELELVSLAARKRELSDLFHLRQILEEMASMPIGERNSRYVQLDVDFHLEIANLSGNTVMATMLRAVMEELVPRLQEISWSEKRSMQTDESHGSLYSALVAGDVELARDEIKSHLQVAYDALLNQVRKPPVVSGEDDG